MAVLKCGHKFCLTCLLEARDSGTLGCPYCRGAYFVSKENHHRPGVREQRGRNVIVQWIKLCVALYCFADLFFQYGRELRLKNIVEALSPLSTSIHGYTLKDHATMSHPLVDLVGFLGRAFFDLCLLQLQSELYRVHVFLSLWLRLFNFFCSFFS